MEFYTVMMKFNTKIDRLVLNPTTYSISIRELLDRPTIRNDKPWEWMNKMTDEEIKQFDEETEQIIKERGDIADAFSFMTTYTDRGILYTIFQLYDNENKFML
jgi:hypothetical protein